MTQRRELTGGACMALVLAAACLAGCTSAIRSSATTTGPSTATTTAPASTTTTSISSTTTITTTIARAVTVVLTYDPWTSSGTVKPGVTVTSTVSGRCTAGNGHVYFCVSSAGKRYYECWPNPSRAASQVACDIAWSTEAVMMTLVAPLASPGYYTPVDGEYLPGVALSNGDRCSELWGTAAGRVNGVELDYDCTAPSGSAFYAGGLDSSSSPWTLRIARSCYAFPTYSCSGPLVSVDVTKAWEYESPLDW